MDTIDPFVARLMELQAREDASDADFARYLGVSPSVWGRTKKGLLPPSLDLARGAFARYPHRTKELAAVLARHSEEP